MTDGEALQALTITASDGQLALAGEIDAHTAPQLGAAIAEVATPHVVLDMSAVEFVDSSGLRVLIEAHKALEENGGRLVLHDPSPAVRRLLEVSGVGDHLHVEQL